ncbi:MAG: hypothetical protein WCY93_11400, partial [Anaerolineaceae bacterium]
MSSYSELREKWAPVLEHDDFESIGDSHKKNVTARILENTIHALRESRDGNVNMLNESPTTAAGTGGFGGSAAAAGPVAGYDPILISLVRRAMPNLIAYDICGVQPMTGPTGLIFALRSKYNTMAGNTSVEAFYNEADTAFAGTGTHGTPFPGSTAVAVDTGTGMTTGAAEGLGYNSSEFNEMTFSIEKV